MGRAIGHVVTTAIDASSSTLTIDDIASSANNAAGMRDSTSAQSSAMRICDGRLRRIESMCCGSAVHDRCHADDPARCRGIPRVNAVSRGKREAAAQTFTSGSLAEVQECRGTSSAARANLRTLDLPAEAWKPHTHICSFGLSAEISIPVSEIRWDGIIETGSDAQRDIRREQANERSV